MFLMLISTLVLASSAAYYSVFGLSSLFAGAKFEVIILASSLEFSKLIVASYLHNNWHKAGWLKYYLSLAVAILMLITSAGIYGFLTSAYQKTSDEVTLLDKRVSVVNLKKERLSNQLSTLLDEKTQLNKSISDLSNGLSNNVIQYKDKQTGQLITTTSSSTRRVLERQLNDSKNQRDLISVKIEALTDSVTNLDFEILDIQSNSEVIGEIGTLRYLSKITGMTMDVVVNWFTLLIVFVFDPLAIAMVIALNKMSDMKSNVVIKPKHIKRDDDVVSDIKKPIVSDEPVKSKPKSKPITNKSNQQSIKRYSDSDKFNEGFSK